jgi:hypothetical protein
VRPIYKIWVRLHVVPYAACRFHCIDAPTGALAFDIVSLTLPDRTDDIPDNGEADGYRREI